MLFIDDCTKLDIGMHGMTDHCKGRYNSCQGSKHPYKMLIWNFTIQKRMHAIETDLKL